MIRDEAARPSTARILAGAVLALLLSFERPEAQGNPRDGYSQLGINVSGPVETSHGKGARVEVVVEGGGAEAAGVRRGDVVVGADSKATPSIVDLLCHIQARPPGRQVTLKIVRDGSLIEVPVVLGPWTLNRPPRLEDCAAMH